MGEPRFRRKRRLRRHVPHIASPRILEPTCEGGCRGDLRSHPVWRPKLSTFDDLARAQRVPKRSDRPGRIPGKLDWLSLVAMLGRELSNPISGLSGLPLVLVDAQGEGRRALDLWLVGRPQLSNQLAGERARRGAGLQAQLEGMALSATDEQAEALLPVRTREHRLAKERTCRVPAVRSARGFGAYFAQQLGLLRLRQRCGHELDRKYAERPVRVLREPSHERGARAKRYREAT